MVGFVGERSDGGLQSLLQGCVMDEWRDGLALLRLVVRVAHRITNERALSAGLANHRHGSVPLGRRAPKQHPEKAADFTDPRPGVKNKAARGASRTNERCGHRPSTSSWSVPKSDCRGDPRRPHPARCASDPLILRRTFGPPGREGWLRHESL